MQYISLIRMWRNAMEQILIVEDDWELNRGIARQLEKEHYATLAAHTMEEAKSILRVEPVHLVLLDVNLPDGDGFALLEWMNREQKACPVVFLTARDLEEDALRGYELGAVDYVTKPFSIKILLKKIAVILRQTSNSETQDYEDGYLTVSLAQGKVRIRQQLCAVTPTEFCILSAFLHAGNQLLTYDMLLDVLWENGNQIVDKHALAVNIGRLRAKIEDGEHKYIANVYGMGYQWIGN